MFHKCIDLKKLRDALNIADVELDIIDTTEQKPRNNSYALIFNDMENEWQFCYINKEGMKEFISFENIKDNEHIKDQLLGSVSEDEVRKNPDILKFFGGIAKAYAAKRNLIELHIIVNQIINELEAYIGKNQQLLDDPATKILLQSKIHIELIANSMDAGATEFVIEGHPKADGIEYNLYDNGKGFPKKFLKDRPTITGSELYPSYQFRFLSSKEIDKLGGRGRGLELIVNKCRKKQAEIVFGNRMMGETSIGALLTIRRLPSLKILDEVKTAKDSSLHKKRKYKLKVLSTTFPPATYKQELSSDTDQTKFYCPPINKG